MVRTMLIAGASALALSACGQEATVETTEPMAEQEQPMAPAQAQMTDAEFVQNVANSDSYEIQAGELAAARGARADVKEFGQMMVTDHGATTQELTTLAPTIGLSAPTPALDASHTAQLEALRNATGEAFDDLYLDQQVEAHENAVRLFESYVSGAPQGQLRQWAETTLPKLRTHLERAQTLENAT